MTKHIQHFIAFVGLSTIAFTGAFSSLNVQAQAQPTADIVETAKSAGNFTSLVTALEKADLVSTLKGAGPFTVFAPTDAAFAKLPSATVNSLLNDPAQKSELVKILTYHVVAGKVPANQVVTLSSAKTVQGSDVKITVKDGNVFLNDNVKVVTTDIQASNGIIHVIDTVLTVPATTSTTSERVPLIRTGGLGFDLSILALIAPVLLGLTTVLSLSDRLQK